MRNKSNSSRIITPFFISLGLFVGLQSSLVSCDIDWCYRIRNPSSLEGSETLRPPGHVSWVLRVCIRLGSQVFGGWCFGAVFQSAAIHLTPHVDYGLLGCRAPIPRRPKRSHVCDARNELVQLQSLVCYGSSYWGSGVDSWLSMPGILMLPDTFITYTHTCRPSHSSAAGDGCPTEPNSWDDRIIIIFNVGKMYLAIKVILLLLYHGCETACMFTNRHIVR